MEITITEGDGIPEGSILSIKCGTVHCQSQLEFGRPIYIPCSFNKKKEDMSIGLLQEVCRETMQRPQPADNIPIEFKDYSGKSFSSLKMRVSDKSVGPPKNSAQIKGKHNNAISACRYLEDHNVAGIMRSLVKELLQARPVQPLKWIEQNASKCMTDDMTLEDVDADKKNGAEKDEKDDEDSDSKDKKDDEKCRPDDKSIEKAAEEEYESCEKIDQEKILSAILKKMWMFKYLGSTDMAACLKAFKRYSIDCKAFLAAKKSNSSELSVELPDWVRANNKNQRVQILAEGEPLSNNENFFVIQKGKFEVFADNQKVNILKSGDFFGERAFVLDMPRGATVECVSDECVIWGLGRDEYEDLIHNNFDLQAEHGGEYFISYSDNPLPDDYDISDEDLENVVTDKVLERLEKEQSDRRILWGMLKKLWCFKKLESNDREKIMDACIKKEIDCTPMGENEEKFSRRSKDDNSIIIFEQNEMSQVNESMYFLENGEVDVYIDGGRVNTLKSGSLFGELSFVFSLPRSADCRLCMPPQPHLDKNKLNKAILWELDRDTFDRYVGMNDDFLAGKYSNIYYKVYSPVKSNTAKKDGAGKTDAEVYAESKGVLRNLLKDLWVFKYLDAETFDKVVEAFEREETKMHDRRGSVSMIGAGRYRVLEEGAGSEKRDYMYVIEEGDLDVMRDEIPINQLSAGDFFGELAFIYGLPRQASVVMTSQTLVMWRLSRENFFEYIGDNEAITCGEHSGEYYRVYDTKVPALEDSTSGRAGNDAAAHGGKIGDVFSHDTIFSTSNNCKTDNAKEREMQHSKLIDLLENLWVFNLMKKEERKTLGSRMKRHVITRQELRAADMNKEKMEAEEVNSDDDPLTKQLKKDQQEGAVPFIKEGDSGTESMYVIEQGTFQVFQDGEHINTLKKGDMFGEQSLIYGIPRQATVSLYSDSGIIWEINQNTFDDLIRDDEFLTEQNAEIYYKSYTRAKKVDEQSEITFHNADDAAAYNAEKAKKKALENKGTSRLNHMLKTTWVFKHMSDEERNQVKDAFVCKNIVKPQNLPKLLILEEGMMALESMDDDSSAMYLIESGSVEVTRGGMIVGTLSNGDFFGELSLVYETSRQASVYIVSNTAVLWQLSRTAFNQFVKGNQSLIHRCPTVYYSAYDNSKIERQAELAGKSVHQKIGTVLPKVLAEYDTAFGAMDEQGKSEFMGAVMQKMTSSATYKKDEDLPFASEDGIYFIEQGSAELFEGFQILSRAEQGEIIGEELLDSVFVDFVSSHVRMCAAQDGTVAWRIPLSLIRPSGVKVLKNPPPPSLQITNLFDSPIKKTCEGVVMPPEIRENVIKILSEELEADVRSKASKQIEELLYNMKVVSVKQGNSLAVKKDEENTNGDRIGDRANGNGYNGANGSGNGGNYEGEVTKTKQEKMREFVMYYIQSGSIEFFDKWQLLSAKSAGEIVGLEFLDEFLDFDSTFRYDVKKKSKVWRIEFNYIEPIQNELKQASSATTETKNLEDKLIAGIMGNVDGVASSDAAPASASASGTVPETLNATTVMQQSETKAAVGAEDGEVVKNAPPADTLGLTGTMEPRSDALSGTVATNATENTDAIGTKAATKVATEIELDGNGTKLIVLSRQKDQDAAVTVIKNACRATLSQMGTADLDQEVAKMENKMKSDVQAKQQAEEKTLIQDHSEDDQQGGAKLGLNPAAMGSTTASDDADGKKEFPSTDRMEGNFRQNYYDDRDPGEPEKAQSKEQPASGGDDAPAPGGDDAPTSPIADTSATASKTADHDGENVKRMGTSDEIEGKIRQSFYEGDCCNDLPQEEIVITSPTGLDGVVVPIGEQKDGVAASIAAVDFTAADPDAPINLEDQKEQDYRHDFYGTNALKKIEKPSDDSSKEKTASDDARKPPASDKPDDLMATTMPDASSADGANDNLMATTMQPAVPPEIKDDTSDIIQISD